VADPIQFQFNLPKMGRPSDVILNEVWYPGSQAYREGSTSSRIYDAILGLKAVVIHATAGSSSEGLYLGNERRPRLLPLADAR
jgi:N-acetylmuramoyl-L-alanine amidase